jgi:hypothetical protein
VDFLCLDIWWYYAIFDFNGQHPQVCHLICSSVMHSTDKELGRNCRMRERTVGHIFEIIENLEREIALLKALVQQAISDKKISQDILVDDVAYLGGSTDQESIRVDAEIVEDDAKPRAKLSKKDQIHEARRRASDWAKSEQERKKEHQGHTVTQGQGS